MKALGADINDFYKNGWPEGHYHDDYDETIGQEGANGELLLDPEKKYDLDDLGVVINERTNEYKTFSYFYSRWKKNRFTATLVVVVPKDAEEKVRALLIAAGYPAKESK